MGGGLMQLVAYGAQDIYLTGNPQITFFKVVYRRHTNFAIEAIEQVFTGNVALGKKTSCTIARNGDLVGRMYLEVDLAFDHSSTRSGSQLKDDRIQAIKNINKFVFPGHSMINYVDIEIGGQCIDKHYGEWLNIWKELTESIEGLQKHNRLIDCSLQAGKPRAEGNDDCDVRKVFVPLQFWFNRNPGLALPLIALQYHEVKINIMFNKMENLLHAIGGDANMTSVKIENICLYCDYIFLDTDERRRFAQVSHEYLIEQVQFNGRNAGSGNQNIGLRFNHPCKEIVWVAHNNAHRGTPGTTWKPFEFVLTNNYDPLISSCVLQLNGHDRFREREGTYFTHVQKWQHHTGGHQTEKGIHVYSFALNPEEHQPSGTCNFSRIDNSILVVNAVSQTDEIRVYATNYNVLRIMSGMGGLAYSN